MMQHVSTGAQSHEESVSTSAEHILVVRRDFLFPEGMYEGFLQGVVKKNVAKYEQIIREKGQFLPRPLMEQDEHYKQIIPYFVFTYEEKLFLMQRKASATEQRLANKYSLGIGGHVHEQDLINGDIAQWGQREFYEEVFYKGKVNIAPLGILNDESNAVGRVHMGVVYLLHGDSPEISIRSELKHGALYTREECEQYYGHMESWSQMVFDALKTARYI